MEFLKFLNVILNLNKSSLASSALDGRPDPLLPIFMSELGFRVKNLNLVSIYKFGKIWFKMFLKY